MIQNIVAFLTISAYTAAADLGTTSIAMSPKKEFLFNQVTFNRQTLRGMAPTERGSGCSEISRHAAK
jgi:hypothetical protein